MHVCKYDILAALSHNLEAESLSKLFKQKIENKLEKKLICGIKQNTTLVNLDVLGRTITKPKSTEPKL